jgi:phosphonate transport system substrate-binding protein
MQSEKMNYSTKCTANVSCLNALLMTALLLVTAACGKSGDSAYQPTLGDTSAQQATEYVIGIHPLHNPQRLMELYGPIADYMNSTIPEARFRLEASRNYEEFEKKLYSGHFAFAMPNPYQTLQSLQHGYRIFGKMCDDEIFRGIILVRRDSGIQEVADLKGKVVAYPSATALAATMMPQYFLHTHGLNVNLDIENRYVGSQESAIENVLRGHAAAAATWPVPWKNFLAERPDMAAQLEVKWETKPLLNNGWVVRNDVPAGLVDQFAQGLFGLEDSKEGRAMLTRLPISCFEPAVNETYRPVADFLDVFSKSVREVEH